MLQDLSLSQLQKREQIKSELSAEVYEEVLDRNKLDETLYQIGKDHFENLLALKSASTQSRVA